MVVTASLLSGCSSKEEASTKAMTPEQRNAAIVAIAQQFAATQDAEAAGVALDALALPDQAQAVLALAESYIAQGTEEQTTLDLVGLAKALGPVSRMAEDYLAQHGEGPTAEAVAAQAVPPTPAPTDTPVPPTNTPEPTATATITPTVEPTATPTAAPQPAVTANSEANLRQGPGTNYPVVGAMAAGEQADVLGRNADSTWWQVMLANGKEGWVNASLVTANPAVDGVAIAQNIPAPPATSTPRPQPTPPAAAPTATPVPTPAGPAAGSYTLVEFRLRPVGQDAQRCDGGDHNIFVKVIDAGGNPIDGVRVREVYTNNVQVTGAQGKGAGRVQYDIYRGGGGVVEIVDDNNNPIGPQTPGMSDDWPPFDLMLAAGYCNCKPHPDPQSCRADLESKNYLFAVGHYVYEVTFQRR